MLDYFNDDVSKLRVPWYIYLYKTFNQLSFDKYPLIIGNKHIHHWIIFTVILLLSMINMGVDKRIVEVIRGFSVIMVVHGLMYADRFDFEV